MSAKRIAQIVFWVGIAIIALGVVSNDIPLGQIGVLIMLGGGLAASISVYMERRENG